MCHQRTVVRNAAAADVYGGVNVAAAAAFNSELQLLLNTSADLKAKFRAGVREPLLPGRVMALVFEKQSLRTRVPSLVGPSNMVG